MIFAPTRNNISKYKRIAELRIIREQSFQKAMLDKLKRATSITKRERYVKRLQASRARVMAIVLSR